MTNGDPSLNPVDGLGDGEPGAPPRDNGELVFTAPWQSRLFATTMRLWEQGVVDWEIFRQGLIVQIALHEADLAPGDHERFDYWGCWQRALEKLLADLGVVSARELATQGKALASRPPDH
jgi:nitrile hydratase accessory protein